MLARLASDAIYEKDEICVANQGKMHELGNTRWTSGASWTGFSIATVEHGKDKTSNAMLPGTRVYKSVLITASRL